MKTQRPRSGALAWVQLAFAAAAVVLLVLVANMAWGDIPRTADGKPDLSGYYDTATVTPLTRPRNRGEFLEANQAEADEARRTAFRDRVEVKDPDRDAPRAGGDGSAGPAGNVGGYQTFWIDAGEKHVKIDGKYRTSIIIDPPNGRHPPTIPEARGRNQHVYLEYSNKNDGTAWWLDRKNLTFGPYDDPEVRPLQDRCLIGFGSTGGPPMLPTLYNNHKRIVQTPGNVMILTEMVHDARVVRMNGEHAPDEIRRWLGDSIGWWEGDTLVVETTNFNDTPSLGGASRHLKVVERFSRIDEKTVLYNFTVTDPQTWTAPWTGEYTWEQTAEPVYEYACHEGNYAMGNILCGARRQEAEKLGGEAFEQFMRTSCPERMSPSDRQAFLAKFETEGE